MMCKALITSLSRNKHALCSKNVDELFLNRFVVKTGQICCYDILSKVTSARLLILLEVLSMRRKHLTKDL